ncbi:MAG: DUF2085 domain-containing protein [Chlorobiaceae bacterium]|nr:DUF2085 domain-containing protein [Chlorobiaceae bacterium]
MDHYCRSDLLLLLNVGLSMVGRIRRFGSAPLCNLRPERAFRIGSFVFPLCARSATPPVVLSVILALPLAIDWTVQKVGILESTNARRFVTGVLFGFALAPHSI